MAAIKEQITLFLQSSNSKKWVRRSAYFFGFMLLIFLLFGAGFAYYFNHNKVAITQSINATINDNISGHAQIGDFEYQFLKGFPNLTIDLKNVTITDSLYNQHKHQLLRAEKIEVRLHLLHLLSNKIDFQKIAVQNATVYIFKDSTGYSNTAVFKAKKTIDSEGKSNSTFEVKEISMENVHFVLDNQLGSKLFDFEIHNFDAKPNFDNGDWSSDVFIDTQIHNLVFNTTRGSFARDEMLRADFKVNYKAKEKRLDIISEKLKIGADDFELNSFFNFSDSNTSFQVDLKAQILWSAASRLLSPNISEKLDRFAIKKPLSVTCKIDGDLAQKEDPLIVVNAIVKDNEVTIPDAILTNCSFQGVFTNQLKKKDSINNVNSAIILHHFSASYHNIPFNIKRGVITNLDNPVVTGNLTSNFDISKLNDPENEKWLHFSSGKAQMNLNFRFGILDFYINKPRFTGNVIVANASFQYHPNKVKVENTNLRFQFTQDALIIDEFQFKERNTSIQMKGRVDNFLNLYYDAPEKMVLKWSVYSPHLDIKQFLTTLSQSDQATISTKKSLSTNFQKVLKKSSVVLDVRADKIVYEKLTATNAVTKITMNNSKLLLSDGFVKMAGGTINFKGTIANSNKQYLFATDVVIKNVEIATFLKSFNNFGIQSFTPSNIKGNLFCTANVSGKLNSAGDLIKTASKGDISFDVKKGVLVNFKPFVNIGQVAFPFRDVNNIAFSDLSADLSVRGQDIVIENMRGTSNVLNFDMNGVYSFGANTSLNVTVPLRNPKNDSDISSKKERELIRQKGLVLRLLVIDENGKIKIKWRKKDRE